MGAWGGGGGNSLQCPLEEWLIIFVMELLFKLHKEKHKLWLNTKILEQIFDQAKCKQENMYMCLTEKRIKNNHFSTQYKYRLEIMFSILKIHICSYFVNIVRKLELIFNVL